MGYPSDPTELRGSQFEIPVPGQPVDREDAIFFPSVFNKALVQLLGDLDPVTYAEGVAFTAKELDEANERCLQVSPEEGPTFGLRFVLRWVDQEPPDVPTYTEKQP